MVSVHPVDEAGMPHAPDDGKWAAKRDRPPPMMSAARAREAGWGVEEVGDGESEGSEAGKGQWLSVEMVSKEEQARIDKAKKILEKAMSGRKSFNPVIRPTSRLATRLRRAAVAAAIYSSIVEPFCAGFDVRPPPAWLVVFSTLADLAMLAHTVSGFFTGYSWVAEDGSIDVELRLWKIGWHHLTHAFPLDIASCLPVQVGIVALPLDQGSQFLRLAGFIKGARVFKVHAEANRMLGSAEVQGGAVGTVRIVVAMALLCHFAACAWFWVLRESDTVLESYPEEPLLCVDRALLANTTDSDRYLCALYWASGTVGGVGYGDVRPVNGGEVAFAMLAMAFGAAALGALLVRVRGVWMGGRRKPLQLQEKYAETIAFLRHRRLQRSVTEGAVSHARFLWEATRGYDDIGALRQLPVSVQTAAFRFVHADIVAAVDFLRQQDHEDQEFWRQLMGELREEVYVAGTWVFHEGRPANRIYIVKQGQVQLVQESSNYVFETMKRGGWFGETSHVAPKGRKSSAKAVEHTVLLEITQGGLARIADAYPDVWNIVERTSDIRIRRNMGARWKIVWGKHRNLILETAASITRPRAPWPFLTMDKFKAHARRMQQEALEAEDKAHQLSMRGKKGNKGMAGSFNSSWKGGLGI